MADAYQRDLLNIFQEARLEVPRYQRSYAWNEKQVNDLMEDIEYASQRRNLLGDGNDVVHYFGTIVLDEVREVESPAARTWTLYEVVDGQQRLTTISLVVGCICEEVDNLKEFVNIDEEVRETPEDLYESHRNIYIKFRNKKNGRKLQPASLTEEAYQKLVVWETDPGDFNTEGKVLPARKLSEAKSVVLDWLSKKRQDILDGDSIEEADQANLREYYGHLEQMLTVIGNTFEVTRYEVDNTAEAGRMFEVVNDRGKDLTTAEKVKSHLLYCASEVKDLDAEKVARNFNEAIETITFSGGDEDTIDHFVERHWEMFTGETPRQRPEPGIDELHRRIKQIDRYAPLERDQKKLIDWIEAYVDSLVESATAFTEIYNINELESAYDIDNRTIDKLRSINNSGAATNFRPLLMAAHLRFDVDSEEFERLVHLCEVFSFRAYQIVGRSTTLLRRNLKQQAHRLYVANQEKDDLRELFGTVPLDLYYDSREHAVDEICLYLDDMIGKRAPESDFVEYLTKPDVIDGETTTGWGGFKSKSTLSYLFYEYERYLRKEEGDTNLHTLVDYGTFDQECEIEHISPQNPDGEAARLANHNSRVDSLANLAFLWPEDNQTASNDRYEEKYRTTYSNSGVLTLLELPNPAKDGWDKDSINNREDKLVNFCLKRWSGETTGYVYVDEVPSRDERKKIREDIQSHFAHSSRLEIGHLPTIKITDRRPDGKGTTGFSCDNCGATKIGSIEDGKYRCTCGVFLEYPSYQITSRD